MIHPLNTLSSLKSESKVATSCSSAENKEINNKNQKREAAKLYRRAAPCYRSNCCIVCVFFLKFLAIIFYSLLSSLLRALKTESKCFSELEPAHLCSPSCKQVASTNQSLHFKLNHWLLLMVSSGQSVHSRWRQMLSGACEACYVVRGEPKGLICSINNWQIGSKISKSSFGSCCILPHLATNPPDILFLNSKHCVLQELHNEHRVNKGEGHREGAEQRHPWAF